MFDSEFNFDWMFLFNILAKSMPKEIYWIDPRSHTQGLRPSWSQAMSFYKIVCFLSFDNVKNDELKQEMSKSCHAAFGMQIDHLFSSDKFYSTLSH